MPNPKVDAVQGEAGGILTLGDKQIGRDDAKGTSFLLEQLGEPDETIKAKKCFGDSQPNTRYRWGALTVTVPEAEFEADEWSAFPVGAVSGWVIDQVANDPWPNLKLTGPEGTELGANLKTLKAKFESNPDWDYAGLDEIAGKPTYTIFTGDTIGASFTLDKSNRVVAMRGGWVCED